MSETDPASPTEEGAPSVGNTLGLVLRQLQSQLYLDISRRVISPGFRLVDFECEVREGHRALASGSELDVRLLRNHGTRTNRVSIVCDVRALQRFVRATLEGQSLGEVAVTRAELALTPRAPEATDSTADAPTPPLPTGVLTLEVRDARQRWGVVGISFGIRCDQGLSLHRVQVAVFGPAIISRAEVLRDLVAHFSPHVSQTGGFLFPLDVISGVLRRLFVSAGWRAPSNLGLLLCGLRLDLHTITLDFDRHRQPLLATSPPPLPASLAFELEQARTQLQQAGRTPALLTQLERLETWLSSAPTLLAANARWRAELARGVDDDLRLRALQTWMRSETTPANTRAASGLLIASLAKRGDPRHTLPLLPAPSHRAPESHGSARVRIARAKVLLTNADDARDALALVAPLEEPPFSEQLHPIVRLEAAITIAQARISIHAADATGHPVLAMEALERALAQVPTASLRCRALLELVLSLEQIDEHAMALELAQRALREAPDDVDVIDAILRLTPSPVDTPSMESLLERRMSDHLGGGERPEALRQVLDVAHQLGSPRALEAAQVAAELLARVADDADSYRAAARIAEEVGAPHEVMDALRLAHERAAADGDWDDSVTYIERLSQTGDLDHCREVFLELRSRYEVPREIQAKILGLLARLPGSDDDPELVELTVTYAEGRQLALALVGRAARRDHVTDKLADLRAALDADPTEPLAVAALSQATEDTDRQGLRRLIEHLRQHPVAEQLRANQRRLVHAANAVGDVDEARRTLEAMLQDAPNDREILLLLARQLDQDNNASDLLALTLPRLRSVEPTTCDLELRCLAAGALLERGDPGESARLIARWRDAGGAFSDVDPATRRRARRLEFEGILASGDVERAVTFAQHAMDQGAEEAPRWILRAAEQASGATRITTLRKLVAVRPEDPRALSALEAALRQVDDTAGLVALLEHRATTGTVLDRLTALRSLAAMLPNVAAAEADRRALVQRILALDPTDPESLAALASMERDGTRRRELWERLIQVVAADDPRRALALCELAEAAAPEDPERARALLDTLLASDPSNERALTLGLEIAPALDDPSWTRRCALAILAAGTTEFSRPPLNLTLARACVDMERFDEALVASGRAATTASAGSDEHIDAARLWADLAGNYGSDAEHRLAARERRRAVGSGLGESELLEELQLYERDPESREEAVTFVCRSLNSWAPPLALAASSWLEQLPTEDSAEGTARTDALAAVAVTLHDEALRRKIVDTAISLARRYERPDTVLQLLDSVDLTRWSEALVELRRWALARAGRREPEIRRIERAMLDPDTPLHPSTIQRFKACFDGPAESVHALRTLIAEATADRAAQLARHALSDDTVEISDEGFYDLLEALAGCSMTVPVDWENFTTRFDAHEGAALATRAIEVAHVARRLDPRCGVPSSWRLIEDALTRFPDHVPLYRLLVEHTLGAGERNSAHIDGLVSRLDKMAQRRAFDDDELGQLYERTADALSTAAGNTLLLQKAKRCAVGSGLRDGLESALVQRQAWQERYQLLDAEHDERGASPWMALMEEASGRAEIAVFMRIQWGAARALIDEQRDGEAIELLRAIVEQDTAPPRAVLELGLACARAGAHSEAAQHLGALAQRVPFPTDLGVTRRELTMRCGSLCEEHDDRSGALRWYEASRQESNRGDPDWLDATEAIFRIRVQADETHEAADVALGVIRVLEPNSHLSPRWIRRCVETGGGISTPMLQRGLALKPSDPVLVDAVIARYEREESSAALASLLEAALEDWDGSGHEDAPARWRSTLASLYMDQRDDAEALKKAEQIWRDALQKTPEDQATLHGLADVIERLEDRSAALEIRARAATLDPTDPRNAETIVSKTVALSRDSPDQAMRWVSLGLTAGLREPAFLDACLHAATAVEDRATQEIVWSAQSESPELPPMIRAKAALALGERGIERDRAEALRHLETAAALARTAAPQSEIHVAAATAWLTALLDPRAEPSSPAIEVRARAMQRAAMGDSLPPASWRAEIDLLAGPLREPEAALALALDAVVARPDNQDLVTRLTTLASELKGESGAVAQLKAAAVAAAYHDRDAHATLRTLAQVARAATMPAEARWALDQLSRDAPMPASMINVHAWTLRQLGGVDDEVLRVIRASSDATAVKTVNNLLQLFEESAERASRALLERLSTAPAEARARLLGAAIDACMRTPASAAAVLPELLSELFMIEGAPALKWSEIAAVQDVPDAILARIARALLGATPPEASRTCMELCERALRGSVLPDALVLVEAAAQKLDSERSDALLAEVLQTIVGHVGPHSTHARALMLSAADTLPDVPLHRVLGEVLTAQAAQNNPIDQLLEALRRRGDARELLKHYISQTAASAQVLRDTAEVAARAGDLSTEVHARREAAARFQDAGELDAARDQLLRALAVDPQDWRSSQLLVDIHEVAHEWRSAFEQMTPVLAQFPDDPAQLRRAGSFARKSNRLRACVDLWNKALSLYHQEELTAAHAEHWMTLAEELHQVLEGLDLHREATELALQISRRSGDQHSIMWSIHAARTAPAEDAAELLEDALHRDPTSESLLAALERGLERLPSMTLLHEMWRRRLLSDGLPPFGDSVTAATKAVVLLEVGLKDPSEVRELLNIIVDVPTIATASHHIRYATLIQADGRSELAESHWHTAMQLSVSSEDPQQQRHLLASSRHAACATSLDEAIGRWREVARLHPDAPLPHRELLEWSLSADEPNDVARSGHALLSLEEGPVDPAQLAVIGRAALRVEQYEEAAAFLEWAVHGGRDDAVDTCARWIDATVASGDFEAEAKARHTFAELSGASLPQPYIHAEFRTLAQRLQRPGAAARTLLERARITGHSDSYLGLLEECLGAQFSPEALVWTIVSILGEDEILLPLYLSFAAEQGRLHADPPSTLAAIQHLNRAGLSTEQLIDAHGWALRETGGVSTALADTADRIDASLDSEAVLEIFEYARHLFDDDERWCQWCMEQCERTRKEAAIDALSSVLDIALETKNCEIVVKIGSLIEWKETTTAPPLPQMAAILELFAARPADDIATDLLEFADRQFARGAPPSNALDPFLCDYTRRNPQDERAIHVLLGSRAGDEGACIEAIKMLCGTATLSPVAQGLAWATGAKIIRSSDFAWAATKQVLKLQSPQGTRTFAASLSSASQLEALLELVRRSAWDLALTEPALTLAASHSAYGIELELLKLQLAISTSLLDIPTQTTTLNRMLHLLRMRNERSTEEVEYTERLAFLASERGDLVLARQQLLRLIEGDLEPLAATPPSRTVSHRREVARIYMAQGDRFAAARASLEATGIAVRGRLDEAHACIEELIPLLPHCPVEFNALELLDRARGLGFEDSLVAGWMYKASQIGHARDARGLLQRSLELEPDDEAAALSLEALIQEANEIEALHDFYRWRLNRVGVPTTDQEVRIVRGYVERLRASLAIHDPASEEAVALLDTLIALSPAHVDARIEQATLQLSAGNTTAAVEAFEVVLAQIAEDDPRRYQAALTVGVSLFETDPARGATLLLQAHQLRPSAEELTAPLASVAALPLEPPLRLRVVEVLLDRGVMRNDLEWLFLDLLAQTDQMEQLQLHAQTMLLDDLSIPLQRSVLELLIVADTAVDTTPKLRASHLIALGDVLETLGEDATHIRTQLPALWTAYGAPSSEVLDEIEGWLATATDPLPYLKGHAVFALPEDPERHEQALRRAFMRAEDEEARTRLVYGIAHAAMARDDPEGTLKMLDRVPPESKSRPEFSDLRLWAVRRLDQVDDEEQALIASALEAEDPRPLFAQLLRLEEDDAPRVFELLIAALPRADVAHRTHICVWLLHHLREVTDRQAGLFRGLLAAVRRFDISDALIAGWPSVHAVLCAQDAAPELDGLFAAVQVSLGERPVPEADLRTLAAATIARLTSPDPIVNLAWSSLGTSEGPLARATMVAPFLDDLGESPNISQGIVFRAWERLTELVPRSAVAPLLQELLQQRAHLREASARALAMLCEERGDWHSLLTLLEFESSFEQRSGDERVNALEWLARVHGDIFDDPEAATHRLTRAVSLRPDVPHLRVSLFERKIEAGAFEDALQIAEQFCISDELRGGARDALLRRAADAAVVHGDAQRALSLLMQRDAQYMEHTGAEQLSLLRSSESSISLASALEEVAGRQSGALRMKALEALADRLTNEVGHHAHAARVLCTLIDEQPARVELFEQLERCYASSQRWDLLASQLVRMASSQPVVIRRRLLERAAQIQRVRLRNPEEAESILHAARALPGENSDQLNLELARCRFERRDFAGVVECCRATIHRIADDSLEAEVSSAQMSATERAVVQLISDASAELHGIDHALLDIYESLDSLQVLPDHAIKPLAHQFLRSGRYERFIGLLERTARNFFAQGEFTSAMTLLSQYALKLEAEPDPPLRHVTRLHLQTFLAKPGVENPSHRRARALISSHMSIRDARAMVESMVDELDDDRSAAGWVLLGDAIAHTDPGEARLAYKRAWTLDRDSIDARLGLLRLLSSMALFDGALEVAMDVLREEDLSPHVLGEVIIIATECLGRLQRSDEALILLERAFDDVPSHWRLGCLLVEALARAGLFDREHARLRTLSRRDLPPRQLARISLRIATLLGTHTDEIELAQPPTPVEIERHLQRALALDPELSQARDMLVELKRNSGDIKSMVAIWQEGLRSLAPGSSRANRLLDLCEVHTTEIPSEALSLDYLLRAISERGISSRILERAERIIRRIPQASQVASGLIIAASSLPPEDRLTQSRVLGMASVAWEVSGDFDAARLAAQAAQESLSEIPTGAPARTR